MPYIVLFTIASSWVIISFLPALVDHSVVVDLDSGGHDVLDREHELGQKSHHLQAFQGLIQYCHSL
jgi:hypothetical protein